MTEQEAIEILREMAKKKSCYRIAELTGLSWPTIKRILKGDTRPMRENTIKKIFSLNEQPS